MAIVQVSVKFEFGAKVYLVTDQYQQVRLVTGYLLRPDSPVIYKVSSGEDESSHYDFELSDQITY
jgi:hypothetical protein